MSPELTERSKMLRSNLKGGGACDEAQGNGFPPASLLPSSQPACHEVLGLGQLCQQEEGMGLQPSSVLGLNPELSLRFQRPFTSPLPFPSLSPFLGLRAGRQGLPQPLTSSPPPTMLPNLFGAILKSYLFAVSYSSSLLAKERDFSSPGVRGAQEQGASLPRLLS